MEEPGFEIPLYATMCHEQQVEHPHNGGMAERNRIRRRYLELVSSNHVLADINLWSFEAAVKFNVTAAE